MQSLRQMNADPANQVLSYIRLGENLANAKHPQEAQECLAEAARLVQQIAVPNRRPLLEELERTKTRIATSKAQT